MAKGTKFRTAVRIYRHQSDRVGVDCGRACAQMVISALHLGGRNPPTLPNASVPVTQDNLRTMENDPLDPGPGGWFTFPDELKEVLNSSQELQDLGFNDWRVASRGASDSGLDALMEDIAASLKTDRLPAILNLKSADHWVVVPTVWVGAKGQVLSLEYVDPAGWAHAPNENHTYIDDCQLLGENYWFPQTPIGLAGFSLVIGSTLPQTYKGKYVAIVHGPAQPLPPAKSSRLPLQIPGPVDPSLSRSQLVAASLRGIADDLGLTELQTLLDLNPRVRVWLVKDIDKSDQEYALASVSHEHSSYGAICVCNAATKEVGHFTISRRPETWTLPEQLDEKETLWWSRRSQLWQPQFPFRLEAGNAGPQYRRLIDGEIFSRHL